MTNPKRQIIFLTSTCAVGVVAGLWLSVAAGEPGSPPPATAPSALVGGVELVTSAPYPVNAKGLTYGSIVNSKRGLEPDLVSAIGTDGTLGFVMTTDLYPAPPKSAKEALALNSRPSRDVPLYDKDGINVIGSFRIESGETVEQ